MGSATSRVAVAVAGLVLLTACAPTRVDLLIDLRTDLVPGIEFLGVRTAVEGSALREEQAALGDRSFLLGARVAELQGIGAGSHHVHVTLVDAAGNPVVDRRVLVDLATTTAVTVLVTRDCSNLQCPPPEHPELDSCFAGQCASARCLFAEADCPMECETATDCPPLADCATARCDLGVCVYAADDTACDAGLWCNPECGCIPLPPDEGPDPDGYCGACGVDCRAMDHATSRCVDGRCALDACEPGFADCDGVAANGCEAMPSWTASAGGDHCGADWAPDGTEAISGTHTGVGRFSIAAGVRVSVARLSGTSGGELRIAADTIDIAGVLDASGAGAPGGDGGHGKGSGGPFCGGDGDGGASGAGLFAGAGGAGGHGHGGGDDNAPGCRYANGGDAAGGGPGGYAARGVNGDTSDDDEVWMGSGGGGGGGGAAGSRFGSNSNYPAGTGGGGGAGGRGGGTIRLEAVGVLSIRGSVLARGEAQGGDGSAGATATGCERYADPPGGSGGSASGSGASAGGAGQCIDLRGCGGGTASTCGGDGGAGGGGSGGGVLLRGTTIEIVPDGIDLRGGRTTDGNDGTLKLRYGCAAPASLAHVGRLDARATLTCE